MKLKAPAAQSALNLKTKFIILEGRVHKSCDQLEVLHRRITDLSVRHKRAVKKGLRPMSKSLAMQLDVHQAMYTTFYSYAEVQAKELALLERILLSVPTTREQALSA